MKTYLKKLMAVLLAAVLTAGLATAAFAVGGPDDPPPDGGGGGSGSASQEFATFDEVTSYAAYTYGASGLVRNEAGTFSGTTEEAVASDSASISGIRIEGTGNGIAMELPDETSVFTIGGDEKSYQVDGKNYNSVISVSSGTVNDDAGYEAICGVGVAVKTGELWVKNSYLASDGPRSTPVYCFSTDSPAATSLVVVDSTLKAHSDSVWMPPFKLLTGGARATLLMTRNNSWFYGSDVISNNWGAISQDTVDACTYVVNSRGMATEGGYGTYLTYAMRLYGAELYGGQYGVFMCGTSDILTDTGAAAADDAEAMSKVPDYPVDTDRVSIVAAPFNAVVVHNSLPDLNMVATGNFRNSVLSTLPEDLPEEVTPMQADDEFFMPGVDILGSGAGCGASYFYSRNLYGSLALVRSMNADFTFDNTETRTSNGVLLQSVITYDPPSASGYLTPEQGSTVPGISADFENGTYTGDIFHEDYQRAMDVTVGSNASLTGKVVSGTWKAWNDLWSEEHLTAALEEDGYTPDVFNNDAWVEDVAANLIRSEDTVYDGTDNLGVSLTIEQGGTWTVTGDSTLKTLTIEDGAVLTVPAGCELEIYTDCDTSNSLLSYDAAAGTRCDALEPGTYTGVVLKVTGEPIEAEPEEASEAEPAASAAETGAASVQEPAAVQESPTASESTEAAESTAEAAETEAETASAQESGSKTTVVPIVCGGVGVLAVIGIVAAVVAKKKKK